MENASKALIIAGAILLSILIISLGIMIFQQASEVVDQNAMSELEVTQFNSKFKSYMGTNVRGAQVNSLINQVIQNNVTNQSDTSKRIKLAGVVSEAAGSKGTALADKTNWQGTVPNSQVTKSSDAGRAMTGKTYQVGYTTDSKTGLIDVIYITAN